MSNKTFFDYSGDSMVLHMTTDNDTLFQFKVEDMVVEVIETTNEYGIQSLELMLHLNVCKERKQVKLNPNDLFLGLLQHNYGYKLSLIDDPYDGIGVRSSLLFLCPYKSVLVEMKELVVWSFNRARELARLNALRN